MPAHTSFSRTLFRHPFSGRTFFRIVVSVIDHENNFIGETSTCWMTFNKETRILYDSSYGIDDDVHYDEPIIISPAVNLPAPCDNVLAHYNKLIQTAFKNAIEDFTGSPCALPLLCEADDADEIHALKLAKGYAFVGDDFYPINTPII